MTRNNKNHQHQAAAAPAATALPSEAGSLAVPAHTPKQVPVKEDMVSPAAAQAGVEVSGRDVIPVSADERFIARACQLWSQLHSASIPVPLHELQQQLSNLYQDVSSRPLSVVMSDSRCAMSRFRDGVLLKLSTGAEAVLTIAEGRLELWMPEQSVPNWISMPLTLRKCEQMTALLPQFVGHNKFERLVSLPLTFTVRAAKHLDFELSTRLIVLQQSTANRVEMVRSQVKDLIEQRKWLQLSNSLHLPGQHLLQSLAEHAQEHVHLSVLKEHAADYAAKVVAVAREMASHMTLENGQKVLTRAQECIVDVAQNPEKYIQLIQQLWEKAFLQYLRQLQKMVSEKKVLLNDATTQALNKIVSISSAAKWNLEEAVRTRSVDHMKLGGVWELFKTNFNTHKDAFFGAVKNRA